MRIETLASVLCITGLTPPSDTVPDRSSPTGAAPGAENDGDREVADHHREDQQGAREDAGAVTGTITFQPRAATAEALRRLLGWASKPKWLPTVPM